MNVRSGSIPAFQAPTGRQTSHADHSWTRGCLCGNISRELYITNFSASLPWRANLCATKSTKNQCAMVCFGNFESLVHQNYLLRLSFRQRERARTVKVFFIGLGYCAEALIRRTPAIEPSGTVRSDERVAALRRQGVEAFAFDGARVDPGLEQALKRAEAIVVSIPPRGPEGPLDRFAEPIGAVAALRRIVYYSTIGVYGEHGSAWVDETSAALTRSERGLARLAEEARWTEAGSARGVAVDILRLPGIYG